MRHRRKAFLLASALALAGCETGGQRLAGTSTSVGTAIGGTAARSDGRPAAGALVVARGDGIVWTDGRPAGRMLDSARADSLGRFRLLAPRGEFSLEIVCDTAQACSDHMEVWQDWADARSGRLPAVRLTVPGSLEGDWKPSDGGEPPWIGIAGTARFVRPDPAGGRFRLEGVSPGDHFLTVLRKQGEDPDNAQKVGTWPVASGRITEVGTVK